MNQCLKCQKSTVNPKFCSRSCSVSYYNVAKPKRQAKKHPCRICGKSMYSRNAKYYCSHACYSEARWKTWKEGVEKTGILNHSKSHKAGNTHRRYLAETKGNHCSICGLIDWNDQPIVLVVDHINGISNDWRVENVRLVCPNCDSQLPTFKNRNKNKGRPR